MPLVRGRLLPEVESAGRAKRFLDVLLWMNDLKNPQAKMLDQLDILRQYLASLEPFVCQIRLWVPDHKGDLKMALDYLAIEHKVVPVRKASAEIQEKMKGADSEFIDAMSTALTIDADCVATNEGDWFPFIEDAEKLFSILLTDCSFLLPCSEIFARGHDVPWAFEYKSWNATWTVFYLLAEKRTFELGLRLLHKAYQKKAPSDAQETGRSLVYNRFQNLCFTRDRLLFYEMQRLAARRAGWKRQRFGFEIGYYLNFNYLLIYGAFDQAALFVSQLLNLGLAPRQVGATYEKFLQLLEKKSAPLHAVFTQGQNKAFIDRIGALRHFAAHRGSLQPTTVVEKLDREPTPEELDADIRAAGLDNIINMLPEGETREGFREMARSNARFARYEKNTVLEDVVPIELDGKFGFIRPHSDTDWNFKRLMSFLNDVFKECLNLL
jgi:hypothetical protein